MPHIKGNGKILLIRFTEGCCKFFQRNAGFQFRVVREVAGNDLLLMEVAHLDGDISKELPHPRPSVEDDRLQRIPHTLQGHSSLPVYINGFALNFLNVHVLLQVWSPYDQDTEAPFEEGNIGDYHDGLRGMMIPSCRCVTYTVPYPVLTLLVLL